MTNKIVYPPCGLSHTLQQNTVELMHQVVMRYGEFTLANLGFLESVVYFLNRRTEQIHFEVNFDIAHLADNWETPTTALGIFKDVLYTDAIDKVIEYRTAEILGKYETRSDGRGVPELVRINDREPRRRDVLTIHCNWILILARLHDLNLACPTTWIYPETSFVGPNGRIDVRNAGDNEGPVSFNIIVDDDAGHGFSIDQIPVFIQRIQKQQAIAQTKDAKDFAAIQDKTKQAKNQYSNAYLRALGRKRK